MNLKEAITLTLNILKQVMEEKLNSNNVEVVTVTPDKLFHMFTKQELEQVGLIILLLSDTHFNVKLCVKIPYRHWKISLHL